MKLRKIHVRNFRRLEKVEVEFDDAETIFVGPNNSGKTTATAVFRCFLGARDFKIHDFSMAKIREINAYDPDDENATFPEIQLDLWFQFDPEGIEFGRVFSLLPNISSDLDRIGIRCSYRVKQAEKLWESYGSAFPAVTDDDRKSISHFLGIGKNFKSHFELVYSSLEKTDGEDKAAQVDPSEGKRILASLLRVDFVDAQRNMDDEEMGRSNKLSSAFSSYYDGAVDQLDLQEESVRIIDENNQRLTDHYGVSLEPLFDVIKGIGVPSANDRDLKLVSSVSAETALKGNSELMYIDTGSLHELPEAYNGLGFKNLVYMAIQVRHFHLKWMQTKKARPLCHLIVIEEPEVHLHAQVQQAFIVNMWNVLNAAAGDEEPVPQLAITTHSSHVVDAVDFAKVRYFRRCLCQGDDQAIQKILNATEIRDLKNFQPEPVDSDGGTIEPEKVLEFLKKYMTLTHCDLFFADGVVLIEGSAERILLKTMIDKSAPELTSKYLSILEVGGAYAHRFAGLLEFLDIPYLVLTDIDSVIKAEGDARAKVCPADTAGATTSNGALKSFFKGVTLISDLVSLDASAHLQGNGNRYVSFQKKIATKFAGENLILHGRTLEETLIYENLAAIDSGTLDVAWQLPEDPTTIQQDCYEAVKSSSFKKTQFALDVLSSSEWCVPAYISEGLSWLEKRLKPPSEDSLNTDAAL